MQGLKEGSNSVDSLCAGKHLTKDFREEGYMAQGLRASAHIVFGFIFFFWEGKGLFVLHFHITVHH